MTSASVLRLPIGLRRSWAAMHTMSSISRAAAVELACACIVKGPSIVSLVVFGSEGIGNQNRRGASNGQLNQGASTSPAHGEVCSSCGHAHAPTAEQVDAASDWRTMLGVVLSIGMRPCTGAVLVLAFARFSDISWIGAIAVLAMSAGTAITVTALALLSVHARSLALKLSGATGSTAAIASSVVTLGGGVILLAMGYGLLVASFAPAPARSMGL